jgi:hypothetical protein
MLFEELIPAYSENHKKNISTNVQLLFLEQVVHIVTTEL